MHSHVDRGREVLRNEAAPEISCACCGAQAPWEESRTCASCQLRVCPRCLRLYGHHMLVCEDCHLVAW